MTDNDAMVAVTPEDREAFRSLCLRGDSGPNISQMLKSGAWDSDSRMQELVRLRHRHQSETGTALLSVNEKSVMVCPQCDGEGGYPDGLDEAACHTDCTRCDGNGWIVDLAALAQPVEAGEEGPPFACGYCGAPSWVDPSDQSPPAGYCHPEDHGAPEEGNQK